MLMDSKVAFVLAGSPLSLVAAAGDDIATDPYDFLGDGPGTEVRNIHGNATLPGQADAMAVGPQRPEMAVAIGTAATNGTSTPSLTVQFQVAPDDGNGSPGSWTTIWQSDAYLIARLTAGAIIARIPWTPPVPTNLRPRFARLNFAIPAGTAFGAGTIAYAQVTTVRDDPYQLQASKNYSVSGVNG